MPQLSPMIGFIMFALILLFYMILLCSFFQKSPIVSSPKTEKSMKVLHPNLWGGSKMHEL